MATVVHLKRSKGVVVQDCSTYIGRACNMGGWHLPKSKWANPYKVSEGVQVELVLAKYKQYVIDSGLIKDIEELRGEVLGCWCSPKPCHGDVLVELLLGHRS